MIDKQIIIDGVNVAGCISFDEELKTCCYEDTREDKIPFANFCQENKNCSYKQLQRKEKDAIQQSKLCTAYRKELINLREQLECKTQECETLTEAKAQSTNASIHNLAMAYRYRKALEEIEEFINNDMCESCRVGYICGEHDEAYYKDKCKECNYSIILDIISGVKDEER